MAGIAITIDLRGLKSQGRKLQATLYRAKGAHSKPFENTTDLQGLKRTDFGEGTRAVLSLSEEEIAELRKGPHKVIYLAVSVEEDGKPLMFSGSTLLAAAAKRPRLIADLEKGGFRFPNAGDDREPAIVTPNGDTPVEPGGPIKPDGPVRPDGGLGGGGPIGGGLGGGGLGGGGLGGGGAGDGGNPGGGDGAGEGEPFARKSYSLADKAAGALRHRREVNAGVRDAVKDAILEKRKAIGERRTFVRDVMLEGLKSGAGRPGAGFIRPGTDPEAAVKARASKGMKRLGDMKLPGIRTHIPEGLLGGQDRPGGKFGPISPGLQDIIGDLLEDVSQSRRFDMLLNSCRSRTTASALEAEMEGGANDGASSDGGADGDATTGANASLEALYETLVADLHARIETGARPGTDDIAQSVRQSLSAGPADTTAYYDFQTLYIAWEDTWTAVYDDYTEKEVAKVYDEIVQIVGEEVAKDIENGEYLDLVDFVGSLTEVHDIASSLPGHKAPSEISGWIRGADSVWPYLDADDQSYLTFLYQIHVAPYYINAALWSFPDWMVQTLPSNWTVWEDWTENKAREVIAAGEEARDSSEASSTSNLALGRLGRMLEGIHQRLYREPYGFDIFAPGSYNFGLVQTYQQKWEPLNYQVGDLISTMPLAPGEKKTYTVTKKVSTQNSSTSSRSSSLMNSSSRSSMARSQADIVAKATYSASTSATFGTNFGMSFGMFKGNANTSGTVSGNAARESQSTKQNIREATLSAAQEYKDEHSLEVSATSSSETETVTTSEISNPNNEITVTYLFYELQRRFEVSSRLDKLTPVVMVALDVPKPSEIDEDWLLAHDWILRRSLLDPSLVAALDYIRGGFAGDELSVEVYQAQWQVQVAAMQELKDNLQVHVAYRNTARQALQASSKLVADKFGIDDAVGVIQGSALPAIGGLLGPLGALAGTFIGGNKVQDSFTSELTKDEVAAAQESARLGMEWADADYQQAHADLTTAVNALEKATQDYVAAVQRRQEMRTRIDQLRIHVKDNILYYMQAIWAHEPEDQRYFRVYDQEVIWPRAAGLPQVREVEVPPDPQLLAEAQALQDHYDSLPFIDIEVAMPQPEIVEEYDKRPLHEVADLDNLMGFKGNYAIYPLRKNNAVTNYMAQQFLDTFFGLRDPDTKGGIPTETEALRIARCLWEKAGNDEAMRRRVVNWLTTTLENQIFVSDEIVVPSGELFIEALPGSHPLLEDFKLRHRAVDLEQAQNNLTHSRVETLRRVKRLLAEDLGDPDVDKHISVTGTDNVIVDTE